MFGERRNDAAPRFISPRAEIPDIPSGCDALTRPINNPECYIICYKML
jgi:hypothetical protein